MKEVLTKTREIVDHFLNRLFNNLNWVVSEFVVSMKDTAQHLVEVQQRCYIMFELAVNLIRMLEVISLNFAVEIFFENELNMTRLAELILLILNRTTIGPDSRLFERLLQSKNTDKITRVAILSPVAGVLINMFDAAQRKGTVSEFIRVFQQQPVFRLETFQFLSDFNWEGKAPSDRTEILKTLLNYFKQTESLPEGLKLGEDVEVCSICYSEPLDSQFQPCQHTSCHKCVQRHLLDNTRCFFCNAQIASVTPYHPAKADTSPTTEK